LMTEALVLPYEDPDEETAWGREATELTVPRSEFDDVDDFTAWSTTSIELADGTVVAERADWGREVIVEYVTLDPITVVGTDQGAKRITVKVTYNGRVVSFLQAIRTRPGFTAAPIIKTKGEMIETDPMLPPPSL